LELYSTCVRTVWTTIVLGFVSYLTAVCEVIFFYDRKQIKINELSVEAIAN